jgi:hypothetical protein
MPLSNAGYLLFQEWNILQVYDYVIETIVEHISGKACGHQRQHERKDVLHVPGSLEQNYRQRDRHARHATQHCRGSH